MDQAVVVLDNGSGFIKAGLHTDMEPTCVNPLIIGRPRFRRVTTNIPEIFVGRSAIKMSAVCALSSTSERGSIRSFDDQSLIFEDLFSNELKIDPCQHPVLLSRLPCHENYQERHLTAEFFERFDTPALVKKPESVLSLMDAGQLNGVVIDCGDSICHSSSIYDGSILLNSVRLLKLGGKDVADCLSRILTRETGSVASSTSAINHVTRIKESLQEMREARFRRWHYRRDISADYQLPDGQMMHFQSESKPELYRAGGILFEPDLRGLRSEGLSDMLLASVANAPSSLRQNLIHNVVLCGGSSLLSGLRDRLEHEAYVNMGPEVKIYYPAQPQFSTWRGGAVLSRLSTFSAMSVTRDEYFEYGPERVEHKFS